MDRLINAILTLSRQGRRVLTPEHLPMNVVVGDIAGSLATLANERDAAIEIDGRLPDLNHDRLAVEQIFQNLIENATKYTRNDVPGIIKVRGKREGGRAIFEIEDNGRGIAPEDHERIFDLFRRSGMQDQKGEGIGLAHVRALAYRLGGSVTVRSKIHEGSTFIVDLPVTYQAEGDER
jgi:Bacteriophytochrome (light-regulated signal transduction histidine kinase)